MKQLETLYDVSMLLLFIHSDFEVYCQSHQRQRRSFITYVQLSTEHTHGFHTKLCFLHEVKWYSDVEVRNFSGNNELEMHRQMEIVLMIMFEELILLILIILCGWPRN